MPQPTLVEPGTKVQLEDFDPDYHAQLSKDDPEVAKRLAKAAESMADLQERLWAESQQALLIVLQAMDTGGKDGTIRHALAPLNPQGCFVAAFKQPTPRELAHDFLWRIHQVAPAKGRIGVFNRSHYEEVLVVRVHKLVPEKVWRRRYNEINEFEELLATNGTRLLKLYLHISKDEQKRRLEERLADPTKHWKFSEADLPERALWSEYMGAYEDALSQCSTHVAPWYIIPANHKWYRNLVVSELIDKTLREMKPQWPKATIDVSQFVIR